MSIRNAAALLVMFAAGCGGGEPGSTTAGPTTTHAPATEPTETEAAESAGSSTEEVPKAPPGLPRLIAGYDTWVSLNRKPIPPRASGDAHSGTKNVYASKPPHDGRFPYGTVLVKEAVRPGRDFVGLIAVMRKERGADPAHNDWRFVEFTREKRGAPFTETASGAICWTCHMGAAKTDYVWIYTLGLGK